MSAGITPHQADAVSFPLTIARAEAYQLALEDRGKIAFVAVLPGPETMSGIHAGLGIAVANERGYHPVPLYWARYASMEAASDHADWLNRQIDVNMETAARIVISTMGGQRYLG